MQSHTMLTSTFRGTAPCAYGRPGAVRPRASLLDGVIAVRGRAPL